MTLKKSSLGKQDKQGTYLWGGKNGANVNFAPQTKLICNKGNGDYKIQQIYEEGYIKYDLQ